MANNEALQAELKQTSAEKSPYVLLKQLFYFRNLPEPMLAALAAITQVRHLKAAEGLFLEGESAACFYAIANGKMQIYKTSKEGKEVILHMFGAGELFAEVPAFNNIPVYPASAKALEDSTLLAINSQGFHILATQHPQLALNIVIVFAQRLHQFSQQIEDLSLRTVESRLAKYLLELNENAAGRPTLSVSKKTLAAILATIPETLSRSLKKLSNDGLIHVDGQVIRLLNIPALQLLAE